MDAVSFYERFHRVYEHSSQFPKTAIDDIPSALITSIDQGNEAFFAPLRAGLPRLYEAVISGSPVRLLEQKWSSPGVKGKAVTRFGYEWGLVVSGTPVVIGIPVPGEFEMAGVLFAKHLRAVPAALHACFTVMDGLAIPEPDLCGPAGFDLPASVARWEPLSLFCENHAVAAEAVSGLLRRFPGNDLRVMSEGSTGHLLLVDVNDPNRRVLHVKDFDFDDVAVVESVETLDLAFANAVRGFPVPQRFRTESYPPVRP